MTRLPWLSQNCRDGQHPTPDGPPPCMGCDCECHPGPTPLPTLADVFPELARHIAQESGHA